MNFNAKINSVTSSSTDISSLTKQQSSVSGGFGSLFSASMSASYSNQLTVANSNTEQREFSMSIYVRAVQDTMPQGMQRILSVLEEAIIIGLKKQT